MSINTKQGELLVAMATENKVFCDACRNGMTRQAAIDYADEIRTKAFSLSKEPEYEYLEIYYNKSGYALYTHNIVIHDVTSAVGNKRFLCYADASKAHGGKVFDADIHKYAVLKKG